MTAGNAEGYYSQEDYYTQDSGQWQGSGAEAMGLSGEVSKDDFEKILNGISPETGEQLRETAKNGEDRAAIDLTFSAPKSVSIMALADGNIKKAHDQAVANILDYIERNNVQTREQVNGERSTILTGSLVAAKFDHLTSRATDPQLHTHAVVANLTQKKDGSWRSLHNDSLYHDKIVLGRLYRNELATLLKEKGYAIEVTDRQHSFFEIKGVGQDLIDKFSSRRQQIEKKVEDPAFQEMINKKYPDADQARIYEIAALGTRASKPEGVTKKDLKESWATIIESKGYTLEGLKKETKKQGMLEHESTLHHLSESKSESLSNKIKKAAEIQTENEAVFLKKDVMQEAAKLSFGEYNTKNLEKAFYNAINKKDIAELGTSKDTKGNVKELFSTPEMQKTEHNIIDLAEAGKNKFDHLVSIKKINQHFDNQEKKQGWKFTEGQRGAAQMVLTSKDSVNIVQGDAGTGKTAYAGEIKKILDNNGGNIIGLGFTGKSAAELESVGINSMTLDSFLGRDPKSQSANLEKGTVFLVDEASMAGAKHIEKVLTVANQNNCKVVIQGDKKQLSSISAGRVHEILQEKTSVDKAELKEVLRQKQGSVAYSVVQSHKEKGVEAAVDTLGEKGGLAEIPDRQERLKAVKAAAIADRSKHDSCMVLADTNKDRNELNDLIRKDLVKNGEVEKGNKFKVLSSSGISASKATAANSYEKGQTVNITGEISSLNKGDQGKIKKIDQNKNTITVEIKKNFFIIDVGKDGNNLSAFESKSKEFGVGDDIVFMKNDYKLGVKNGNLGTIKEIDQQGIFHIKMENGKNVSFNIGPPKDNFKFFNKTDSKNSKISQNPQKIQKTLPYNFIDHGYSLTTHKSQGATVNSIIIYNDTSKKMESKNNFYVGITRAKNNIKVFTDNTKSFSRQSQKENVKSSTLDHSKNNSSTKIEINIKNKETDKKSLQGEKNSRSKSDIFKALLKSDKAIEKDSKKNETKRSISDLIKNKIADHNLKNNEMEKNIKSKEHDRELSLF